MFLDKEKSGEKDKEHSKQWFVNTDSYGLANQKLCYIHMFLDKEKSGEKDKEHSKQWLANTDPYGLAN